MNLKKAKQKIKRKKKYLYLQFFYKRKYIYEQSELDDILSDFSLDKIIFDSFDY